MPFRGVGGLEKSPTFHVNATAVPDADLIMSVRWDLVEHAEPAAEEISPGSAKTVAQGTARNGVAPTPVAFRLDTNGGEPTSPMQLPSRCMQHHPAR